MNNTNKAGDTVAYRSDGYTLIYDYEDEEDSLGAIWLNLMVLRQRPKL